MGNGGHDGITESTHQLRMVAPKFQAGTLERLRGLGTLERTRGLGTLKKRGGFCMFVVIRPNI